MSVNRALAVLASLALAVVLVLGLAVDTAESGAASPKAVSGACFGPLTWLPTGAVPRGSQMVPTRCSHQAHAPTYKFILQGDGNAVLYLLPRGYADPGDQVAVWNSGTWGHPFDRGFMQGDGNFVVYSHAGVALWNSGTAGCGNTESAVVTNSGAGDVAPGFSMVQRSGGGPATCTRRIGGL